MGIMNHTYDLYRDIRERCRGEIYIGVVGPVRTGKSTFIGKFMEELILPLMTDPAAKARAVDELPQSAGGRTVTTTEPKFVPNEAAEIRIGDEIKMKVRLIDCVGYMVDGAVGHMEGNTERMVKTPWSDELIPFTKAAETGTDKVMKDHSTIGLVITTDGSIGDLSVKQYQEAQAKTIRAMKETGKPFIVLVNSKNPYSEEALRIASGIEETEGITAMTINCEQLRREDILKILERILYEFPVSAMEFYFPKWVEMLPYDNPLRADMIEKAEKMMDRCSRIKDVLNMPSESESEYIRKYRVDRIGLSDGIVELNVEPQESYYYEMLTELIGERIEDPYKLMEKLQNYAQIRQEYEKVQSALEAVRIKGYGVVVPNREEITLKQPEIIRQGNKYGVKIKAVSPSIHMIKADIETEISPIVGTQEQAEDLMRFITGGNSEDGIWETNIFGKSVEQMVNDGISAKISDIGPESQEKLQDTMQKIVNDSNGGMVCIII